jgi:hypothetical protein
MRLVLKPDCDAADGVDSINDDVRAHIARYDVDDERWGSDVPADPAEAEEHKRWLLVHRLRLLSVPRFSSLRMDLGVLPPWLPVLTVPEQMLLGLTRMNMILKLNAVGRQQQSRGHAILFGHEGLDPLTLSVVQEQLQSIGNDDTIPALRLVPGSVGVCLVGAREDCHRLCGGNTPAGNRRLAIQQICLPDLPSPNEHSTRKNDLPLSPPPTRNLHDGPCDCPGLLPVGVLVWVL